MADQNSDEILHDFSPRLKHYKDGRIERLCGQETVPPSLDPVTEVQSKDVNISPELPLSARLYLPPAAAANSNLRLPLLVFFHGGAFITFSAFSPTHHDYLNLLVAGANVVAVSVNYRLAPESPLPGAFEDAWQALAWTASEATDDWIKRHADLGRVYLGGDSAGATIAHNVAVRLGGGGILGIRVAGMFLHCPFFYGEEPIGSETAEDRGRIDRLCKYIRPGLEGMDEAWLNPGKDGRVAGMGCRRVLVQVAETDFVRDRGWEYAAALRRSGWQGEVEVVETMGEGHSFGVVHPRSDNGMAAINNLVAFMNHN